MKQNHLADPARSLLVAGKEVCLGRLKANNRNSRSSFVRLIGFSAGFLLVAFWPAAVLAGPPSPLAPASGIAREIANLYWLAFWIAVAIFVLVEGILVYALIRYREKDPAVIPRQVHGSTPLEIAWTAAPALVLLILFVSMLRTMGATAAPPSGMVRVEVIGHQWWWEFRYPDLGLTTANELHVPLGEAIELELTSQDVIHSFWVPQLAGKTDAIPGRDNKMWFQADQAGTYRGQCAELCGAQHAGMGFLVIVQPAEEFEQWLRQQQTPAAVGVTDEAISGEQLFMTRVFPGGACFACHTIDGTSAQGKIGPNLTHFGSRQTIAGLVHLENTPDNLAHWLTNPQGLKPRSKMPFLNLSQNEVAALVQYLGSLR